MILKNTFKLGFLCLTTCRFFYNSLRVKYKEGIHFPMINQLLQVVKKNESIAEKMRERKKNYIEELRKKEEKNVKESESYT